MPFGIMEAIGLVGSIANALNPQAPATASTEATSNALTKKDFKSMFMEAMNEYDSGKPQTEEDIKEKLNLLFSFLDTNKDGSVSKNEFDQLRTLLNNGNLRL